MNKQIKELLNTIELNADISKQKAAGIARNAMNDMFIKYHSYSIKSRNEDTIRLVAALRILLCGHRIRERTKNKGAETTEV